LEGLMFYHHIIRTVLNPECKQDFIWRPWSSGKLLPTRVLGRILSRPPFN